MDGMEKSRNELEHCGTPQATAACGVTVRWIDSVLRDFTPEQIFVQTLVAFEVTKQDPTVVGVNYLRAEDWRGAIDEYGVGMRILRDAPAVSRGAPLAACRGIDYGDRSS